MNAPEKREQAALAPRLGCPFCGALEDEQQLLELDDGGGVAVVCDCCGAIGPTDCRPEQAVALWNGAAALALRPVRDRQRKEAA